MSDQLSVVDYSYEEGGLDAEAINDGAFEIRGIDDATSKEIAIVYVFETLEEKARFIKMHPDLEISRNGNEGKRNPLQGGLLDDFVTDPTRAKWFRDATEQDDEDAKWELAIWRELHLPAFEPIGERIYLRVRFDTADDRDAYADSDGLRIAKKTRGVLSCWWPPRPREDLSSLRFVVDGAARPERTKIYMEEIPAKQGTLFPPGETIRKRRVTDGAVIGRRTRTLLDGTEEAYCWYGDHWLPVDPAHWFRNKDIPSVFHLSARCKKCERRYRRGTKTIQRPETSPRYPIYVPSRDRYQEDRRLTIKALTRDDVPFRVVVVPSQAEFYEPVVGESRLLVLPSDDYVLVDARNWCRDHAMAEGYERHWELDDNVIEFRRLWKGRRIPCDAGVALRACEDLTDSFSNVAVSGLNYQMFVPAETPIPFYRNVHVYSASLFSHDAPFRHRLKYNDDTDICLQALNGGWCTMLVNAFMANKIRTGVVQGGNTNQLYEGDGRLVMARSLEEKWPGIVTTRWKFGRAQHSVRWDKFEHLQLDRSDFVPSGGEYRLVLKARGEVTSPTLRRLLEETA